MIRLAKSMAEHQWFCHVQNTRVSCATAEPYVSDFEAGKKHTGVAYDWGGMDTPEEFDRNLALGHAAGSHSRHSMNGHLSCTTGVDCSGLVSLAWGQTTKFSTRTVGHIATHPGYDPGSGARPGDAFNKPGSHIVLFVEYRPDGSPTFYEASGPAGKVILNDWSRWSYLNGYRILRYQGVQDSP